MNYIRCSLHTLSTTILVFIVFVTVFEYQKYAKHREVGYSLQPPKKRSECLYKEEKHRRIVEKYYEKRKPWRTSNLGTILFKNIDPKLFPGREHKTFLIVIWKSWNELVERHVYNYDLRFMGSQIDILRDCSVKNCKFTGQSDDIDKADAVVINIKHTNSIPLVKNRKIDQRWIFLSEESPMHMPELLPPYYRLTDMEDVFNWTMTYRSDSDIPIPYGRTLPLSVPIDVLMEEPESALRRLVPYWEEKQFTIPAALLISNCHIQRRVEFIERIQKHMRVDVIGECSDNLRYSCPGYIRKDCALLKDYIFYLVLESSSCRQFLTEKCFQNAFSKGAIPVIMGPSMEDCEKLLPPNSFIHVDNFTTVFELAKFITKTTKNLDAILEFHTWRTRFTTVNEHGYFGTRSPYFCRICEALNFNDGEVKTYDPDDLKLFFDYKITCNLSYV